LPQLLQSIKALLMLGTAAVAIRFVAAAAFVGV
jgi:hypothetical protein